MSRPARQHDAASGLGTLVVLAIGLQLMLSGASLAAHACGDSLDRTGIRRLSDSVVAAIREISERAVAGPRSGLAEREWTPAPAAFATEAPLAGAPGARVSAWVLCLPPPAA